MDLRKLKTLIDLVSESNISELEIVEADGKVRIVKGNPAPTYVVSSMPAPSTGMSPGASEARPREPAAEALPPEPTGHTIKSPMVGTFYRTASPGSDPFVDIGAVVKEGQPVCIIEAMKIMNEIESDFSGTIRQILCENGQAVEFGQPLFVVE
jgi:acetyl-CoA carboxylase biotin carboxyl carrier protein